jgi:hypothetical protein
MLEHKCEVCGRMWRKKLKADGKIVCNKHYKQFKRAGCFLDNSPRTQRDKNEIIIENNFAKICLYDKYYNVINYAIIDIDDIDKVKNIKWRINCNGYVINNNQHSLFLHRVILGVDTFVDHINGNRLDNRKSNLRVCTKQENKMNIGIYKGYYHIKDKWIAKIKQNGKQLHLGSFNYKEEAQYARWCAEKILFKDFMFPKEEPSLPEKRKQEIFELVSKKVQRLQ